MSAKFKMIFLVLALFATGATASSTIIKTDTNGNLVNGSGMVLYYFVNDGGNMISTCYGSCSEMWQPIPSGDISVGEDLDINDFGTILREDSVKQISYKRWPLYLYTGDRNPGDINGNNLDGLWFVVKPKSSPFS
jgi:predicted lipoprotein with Yx(FWY)xxD motif